MPFSLPTLYFLAERQSEFPKNATLITVLLQLTLEPTLLPVHFPILH